ncbi:acyl-CoA dehydrogenase domain protein [Amycolatopsis methanolica 239]|uniref:Acyl-CoA dehydrogenase domain protein n=2 Tax=Amycolatopsis methanolica TaxID=1814 RepID=A0A076MQQ5_AMYME|nr:acyl-CoA dehydrogenase family protein [Amycolatopsis methanolica]AIJ21281.1 acyl-CoA dehydrogenase domain protein [Amycolatopsis methanolica 239]
MFNPVLTDEQAALADVVRQLGERAIRPILHDGGRATPADLAGVWRDLYEMGLTAPVNAEYDGQGRPDPGTCLLIAEEIGYGDPGVAYDLVSTCQAALLIEELGTEAQRTAYLPRFAHDPAFSTGVAYFEGFGRTPQELGAVAKRAGEEWRLNGRKVGVTRPSEADVLVVVTADADSDQLAVFAVEPARCTGLEVARDDAVTGKLGLDAVKTGCVELREVRVPETARLSSHGSDSTRTHRAIAALRLGVGAVLLGTARAALAYAVEYANTREAFGHPIAQYQGVAFPLVETDSEIDAARLQLWRASETIGSSADDVAIATSTAEAISRCQRAAMEATRIGINTLGGHGFIQDHPVEQWYRAAATLAALDFDPLESDCGVL